jgi:DNA polymerase III subunit gamma/tau
VLDLVDAILTKDAARGLKQVQSALDAGTDARQFARQVVDYLRNLLLIRMGSTDQVDATADLRAQMAKHAHGFDSHQLLEAIRLFNSAATDSRASWHPGLALEMAFAETIEEKAVVEVVNQVVYQSAPQPQAQPAPRSAAPDPRVSDNQPPTRRAPTAADAPPPRASEPHHGPAQSSSPATGSASAQAKPAQAGGQQIQQPPAAASAPAVSGRAVTQNDVQQNWLRIKQTVKKIDRKGGPMLEGLLNSARPMLKDDALVLSFQSEVVKSKMETPENIGILRQAVQNILGVQLNVRCMVVNSKSAQPADLNVDGDGIVGTALDLGGKIVYDE